MDVEIGVDPCRCSQARQASQGGLFEEDGRFSCVGCRPVLLDVKIVLKVMVLPVFPPWFPRLSLPPSKVCSQVNRAKRLVRHQKRHLLAVDRRLCQANCQLAYSCRVQRGSDQPCPAFILKHLGGCTLLILRFKASSFAKARNFLDLQPEFLGMANCSAEVIRICEGAEFGLVLFQALARISMERVAFASGVEPAQKQLDEDQEQEGLKAVAPLGAPLDPHSRRVPGWQHDLSAFISV